MEPAVLLPTVFDHPDSVSHRARPAAEGHLISYVQLRSARSRFDLPDNKFFTGTAVVGSVSGINARCCARVSDDRLWLGEADGRITVLDALSGGVVSRTDRKRDLFPWCMLPMMGRSGQYVWVGFSDGVVRVFDIASQQVVKEAKEHASSVYCMARVAPSDESTAGLTVAGLQDDFLDTPVGGVPPLLLSHHICFSGSADFIVNIWNGLTCERIGILAGHKAAVKSLLCVGHQRLYSGGDDGSVLEWELTHCVGGTTLPGGWGASPSVRTPRVEGRLLRSFTGHRGTIRALAGALGYVWSGGEDGTVRVWRMTPHGHAAGSEQQGAAAVAEPALDAGVQRLRNSACVHVIREPHTSAVSLVTSLGHKIWTCSLGTVFVWNAMTFELEGQFQSHAAHVTAMSVVHQSVISRVWTCGAEGTINMWDAESLFSSVLRAAKDSTAAQLEDDVHALTRRNAMLQQALQQSSSQLSGALLREEATSRSAAADGERLRELEAEVAQLKASLADAQKREEGLAMEVSQMRRVFSEDQSASREEREAVNLLRTVFRSENAVDGLEGIEQLHDRLRRESNRFLQRLAACVEGIGQGGPQDARTTTADKAHVSHSNVDATVTAGLAVLRRCLDRCDAHCQREPPTTAAGWLSVTAASSVAWWSPKPLHDSASAATDLLCLSTWSVTLGELAPYVSWNPKEIAAINRLLDPQPLPVEEPSRLVALPPSEDVADVPVLSRLRLSGQRRSASPTAAAQRLDPKLTVVAATATLANLLDALRCRRRQPLAHDHDDGDADRRITLAVAKARFALLRWRAAPHEVNELLRQYGHVTCDVEAPRHAISPHADEGLVGPQPATTAMLSASNRYASCRVSLRHATDGELATLLRGRQQPTVGVDATATTHNDSEEEKEWRCSSMAENDLPAEEDSPWAFRVRIVVTKKGPPTESDDGTAVTMTTASEEAHVVSLFNRLVAVDAIGNDDSTGASALQALVEADLLAQQFAKEKLDRLEATSARQDAAIRSLSRTLATCQADLSLSDILAPTSVPPSTASDGLIDLASDAVDVVRQLVNDVSSMSTRMAALVASRRSWLENHWVKTLLLPWGAEGSPATAAASSLDPAPPVSLAPPRFDQIPFDVRQLTDAIRRHIVLNAKEEDSSPADGPTCPSVDTTEPLSRSDAQRHDDDVEPITERLNYLTGPTLLGALLHPAFGEPLDEDVSPRGPWEKLVDRRDDPRQWLAALTGAERLPPGARQAGAPADSKLKWDWTTSDVVERSSALTTAPLVSEAMYPLCGRQLDLVTRNLSAVDATTATWALTASSWWVELCKALADLGHRHREQWRMTRSQLQDTLRCLRASIADADQLRSRNVELDAAAMAALDSLATAQSAAIEHAAQIEAKRLEELCENDRRIIVLVGEVHRLQRVAVEAANHLDAARSDLANSSDESTRTLAARSAELAQARERIESLDREVESLNAQLLRVSADLDHAISDGKKSHSDLSQAEADCRDAQREIGSLRLALDNAARDLQAARTESDNQLTERRKKSEEEAEERQRVDQALIAARNELERSAMDLNSTRDELERTRQEFETARRPPPQQASPDTNQPGGQVGPDDSTHRERSCSMAQRESEPNDAAKTDTTPPAHTEQVDGTNPHKHDEIDRLRDDYRQRVAQLERQLADAIDARNVANASRDLAVADASRTNDRCAKLQEELDAAKNDLQRTMQAPVAANADLLARPPEDCASRPSPERESNGRTTALEDLMCKLLEAEAARDATLDKLAASSREVEELTCKLREAEAARDDAVHQLHEAARRSQHHAQPSVSRDPAATATDNDGSPAAPPTAAPHPQDADSGQQRRQLADAHDLIAALRQENETLKRDIEQLQEIIDKASAAPAPPSTVADADETQRCDANTDETSASGADTTSRLRFDGPRDTTMVDTTSTDRAERQTDTNTTTTVTDLSSSSPQHHVGTQSLLDSECSDASYRLLESQHDAAVCHLVLDEFARLLHGDMLIGSEWQSRWDVERLQNDEFDIGSRERHRVARQLLQTAIAERDGAVAERDALRRQVESFTALSIERDRQHQGDVALSARQLDEQRAVNAEMASKYKREKELREGLQTELGAKATALRDASQFWQERVKTLTDVAIVAQRRFDSLVPSDHVAASAKASGPPVSAVAGTTTRFDRGDGDSAPFGRLLQELKDAETALTHRRMQLWEAIGHEHRSGGALRRRPPPPTREQAGAAPTMESELDKPQPSNTSRVPNGNPTCTSDFDASDEQESQLLSGATSTEREAWLYERTVVGDYRRAKAAELLRMREAAADHRAKIDAEQRKEAERLKALVGQLEDDMNRRLAGIGGPDAQRRLLTKLQRLEHKMSEHHGSFVRDLGSTPDAIVHALESAAAASVESAASNSNNKAPPTLQPGAGSQARLLANVKAALEYWNQREAQWAEMSSINEQLRETNSALLVESTALAAKLRALSYMFETRPTLVKALLELFKIASATIKVLDLHRRLANERQASRVEAIRRIDDVAQEVVSAREGTRWVISNLFTVAELQHLGAAVIQFQPDGDRRPSWRDVHLPRRTYVITAESDHHHHVASPPHRSDAATCESRSRDNSAQPGDRVEGSVAPTREDDDSASPPSRYRTCGRHLELLTFPPAHQRATDSVADPPTRSGALAASHGSPTPRSGAVTARSTASEVATGGAADRSSAVVRRGRTPPTGAHHPDSSRHVPLPPARR